MAYQGPSKMDLLVMITKYNNQHPEDQINPRLTHTLTTQDNVSAIRVVEEEKRIRARYPYNDMQKQALKLQPLLDQALKLSDFPSHDKFEWYELLVCVGNMLKQVKYVHGEVQAERMRRHSQMLQQVQGTSTSHVSNPGQSPSSPRSISPDGGVPLSSPVKPPIRPTPSRPVLRTKKRSSDEPKKNVVFDGLPEERPQAKGGDTVMGGTEGDQSMPGAWVASARSAVETGEVLPEEQPPRREGQEPEVHQDKMEMAHYAAMANASEVKKYTWLEDEGDVE